MPTALLRDPTDADLARAAADVLAGRAFPPAFLRGEPEGVYGDEDDRDFFGVAWWTSPLGSRWVRLVCDESLYAGMDDDCGMPPTWFIRPDRTFFVRCSPGDPGEWVQACGCGVVGPAASILWTGETCGACHDRREEGDPTVPPVSPWLFDLGGSVEAVRFAPEGDRLLIAADGAFELSLPSGSTRHLTFVAEALGNTRPNDILPLPDGRFLVADVSDGRLALCDPTGKISPYRYIPSPRDGKEQLRACRPPFVLAGSELQRLDNAVTDDLEVINRHLWATPTCADVSPVEDVVAFGSPAGTLNLLDLASGRVTDSWHVETPARAIGFVGHLDAERLLLLTGGSASGLNHRMLLYHLPSRAVVAAADVGVWIRRFALSADKAFFVASTASPPHRLEFHRTADLAFLGSANR